MRRLPPLGPIQAFVQVARLGSVKAAADSLSLSSPALTRRIQSLEQFVGAPLFERQHNGLVLNPQGRIFFAEVEPHIDALAKAVDQASSPGNSLRLRIAVPSLFASQRLMPALPSLRDRYPGIHVEIDTAPNRLGRLTDGIDAAIAIAADVDPKFYSRKVASDRIIAIGSRALIEGERPVRSIEDLSRCAVLLHRDMPGTYAAWLSGVGAPAIEPADMIRFDAGQLILDAAAEGLGIAFMLEGHLSSSHDERLVRIFDQAVESPYSYWFACLPSALSRRPVRAFHDWLFETFDAVAN